MSAGFLRGEIVDTIATVAQQTSGGGSRRLLPNQGVISLLGILSIKKNPEYRNLAAFDFVYSQLNYIIRAEGVRNAQIDRRVLVEQAIAQGIRECDVEIAITILVMCNHLSQKDNQLRPPGAGWNYEQLPSQQRGPPIDAQYSEQRARAYSLVKDVIDRRSAGRPPKTEDAPTALHGGRLMLPQMSMERRRHILAATSILKALGHAGFDRMLLELGVPEDVGSGTGLAARANSLARYLLSNPDASAVDGRLVGDAVVKRAHDLMDRGVVTSSGNVTPHEQSEYDEAFTRDINGNGRTAQRSEQRPPSAGAGITPASTIRPDMASLPVRLTGPIRRCIGSFAKGFSRPIGAVPTTTTGSLASHARHDKLS
jgi:hypothetical protein